MRYNPLPKGYPPKPAVPVLPQLGIDELAVRPQLLDFLAIQRRPTMPALWKTRAILHPVTWKARLFAAEGRAEEAEFLYRLAFSRGEKNPELDTAVDRITAKALEIAGEIHLTTHLLGIFKKSIISDVASVRRFLEEKMGSAITLMDVVNLLDFASPLFPLKGVEFTYSVSADDEAPNFSVAGIYDTQALPVDELRCIVRTECIEGRFSITDRNVSLDDKIKRLGLGMRQLLRLALFAKQRGMERWTGMITEDGMFAWPKMGAIVTKDSIDGVRERLAKLVSMGAVDKIDLNADDIFTIAGIEISADKVRNETALRTWFTKEAHISSYKVDEMTPPYKVGMAALRNYPIYAEYEPDRVIKILLEGHFPNKLRKGLVAGKSDSADDASMEDALYLAQQGLEDDFRRALMENWLMNSVADDSAAGPSLLENVDNPFIWMPEAPEIELYGGIASPVQLFAGHLLRI